jgi:nitrous oxidase accessory protein
MALPRRAMLLLCLCRVPGHAAELHVPQDHPSIAEALAAAASGDTIEVRGGVYVGNLVLDRSVHLEGTGRPVIRGEGKGNVVLILAGGCTLRGFDIERSGEDMGWSDAGIRLRSSHNTVEDNHVAECLFGMYLERASFNTIRRNTVQGMTQIELGERGSGIHLFDSHDNLFEENTVDDSRDGVYFDHANRNTVRRCSFRGSRYGLHYMSSDDNRFVENRFAECTAGAAIMFSRRVLFEGNWFVRNRGFSAVGALLKDCYESTASGNVFADDSTGLLLDNSMQNVFRRNNFVRNDLAIHLFSGSDDNLFTENNFRENLSPIRLLGRHTTTRWSENGRGNHWSDYQGYDLDGDGIGDVPYKIQNVFEFLESEFPALRFFLVSPAAAAMRAGEDAFPMFEFSHEVDPFPLVQPVPVALAITWERPQSRAAGLYTAAFGLLSAGLALLAAGRLRPGRALGRPRAAWSRP